MDISRRDFFAATADISWIKESSPGYASAKAGIPRPPEPMTNKQAAVFWARVEIAWRWKYADFMVNGLPTLRLRDQDM